MLVWVWRIFRLAVDECSVVVRIGDGKKIVTVAVIVLVVAKEFDFVPAHVHVSGLVPLVVGYVRVVGFVLAVVLVLVPEVAAVLLGVLVRVMLAEPVNVLDQLVPVVGVEVVNSGGPCLCGA